MGIRLVVEVLDHAPADLTAVDRLVLIVLAEQANDQTRECWPGWELIARRMQWAGYRDGGKNAVSKALANLARRGVEVRVPIGATDDGKAVYAAHGRRTTYRIPPLRRVASTATHDGSEGWHSLPPKDTPEGWHSLPSKGGNPGVRRVAENATPSPQEPSENPQQQGAPSDDEKAAVLAEIRRRKPDASAALIGHIYRQDGPAILAELREQAGRARLADWRASLATMPPCPDGEPGGDQLRPDTNEPQCALCRARRRRTAA